jgi:hypothetical protein
VRDFPQARARLLAGHQDFLDRYGGFLRRFGGARELNNCERSGGRKPDSVIHFVTLT